MAGLGQVCSHVAAVLFKVEAAVKLGFTSLSSTSEACKWNKQFRKEIDVKPVSEMGDLVKSGSKKAVTSVTSSSTDPLPAAEILMSLKQCCPDAVFFTTIPKLEDDETDTADEDEMSSFFPLITSIGNVTPSTDSTLSDDECFDAYQKLCTVSKIQRLEVETRLQRESFLWHMHRKGRITGTTVHDILRRRENTDPENLVSKIMGYSGQNLSKIKAISWGIEKESSAVDQYRAHHTSEHKDAFVIKAGFLIDKDSVFLGASADAVVVCPDCGKGVVEVKCPYKHKDIMPLDAATSDSDFCLTSDGHLKTSHKYYSQVQLQMYVHKVLYCDFVVLTEIGLCVTRVNYDANFAVDVVQKCRLFWFQYVLPEIRGRLLYHSRLDSGDIDDESEHICICRKPVFGRIIRCSNPDCAVKQFHYVCMGIIRKPKGQWICSSCR